MALRLNIVPTEVESESRFMALGLRPRAFLMEYAVPTERKNAIVEELTKKLSDCTIAISTDFRGLPVVEMTNLRRELREKGV